MPFQNRDVSRQLQKETDATGLMGDDSVTDAAAATVAAVGTPTAVNPAAITAASVAARTSGGVAMTYTSNDPTTTPTNAVTINDATALVAAEVVEMWDEIEADLVDLGVDDEALATTCDALVVDVTAVRAQVVALVTDITEDNTAIDALIVDVADIRTQLNLAITALEAAGVLT